LVTCVCHIAADFPISGDLGIISVTLRTNRNITLVETNCGSQIALSGPSRGDLSMTAYAPLLGSDDTTCPGTANASFNWDERLECDGITRHFIPRTGAIANTEGNVTGYVRMTPIGSSYKSVNASAGGGPQTPYLYTDHQDGHSLIYSGPPLTIDSGDGRNPKSIPFLTNILPPGSKLYLTSFNWSYTPPNIPNVSYSFLFAYD